MAQKRPYDEEVVNEVSSKHARQDGPHGEGRPYDESVSKEVDSENLHNSGEASTQSAEVLLHDHHENGSGSEVLKEGVEETESDAPRSACLSHWATSSTSDEDEPPEEMVHCPLYSGYFSFDRPVKPVVRSDDTNYCLLDYPPRKRVPIGPEHQAVVPAWGESTSDGHDDLPLVGICILPNAEAQPVSYNSEKAGDGWIDCRCLDRGSIRCVRQHIAEARDKLRRILGEDTFMELGFSDMGEVVADKWTEEEEQLFHEVVYSNPASLGKNFWNALSAVFPSRTKMEIVSYYFNVFMLRKRAEQNRYDPINVDSDNDEWVGSDSDGADDGVSEDDEDSGIESPVRHDGIKFHQNGLHVHKHEEEDGNVSDEGRETDNNNGKGLTRKSDPDNGFDLTRNKSNDCGENDIQDGSCTSSDSGASLSGSQIRTDGGHEWHEYILDSAEGKSWDSYMSCPKSHMDFLPTCSMIEEVFGGGDYDSKDNKRW